MRRVSVLAVALAGLMLSGCPDTDVPPLTGTGTRTCSTDELRAFRDMSSLEEREDLWIAFVDVGQGDAIWIRTPGLAEVEGKDILVDAGDCRGGDPEALGFAPCGISVPPDSGPAGATALVNFMTESEWPPGSPIHYLVATHEDIDHYGGGWRILRDYLVSAFISPREASGESPTYDALRAAVAAEPGLVDLTPAMTTGIDSECGGVCRTTEGWGRDVKVSLLSANGVAGSDNGASVVLMVEYRGVKVLLAGDAEDELDDMLVAQGIKAQVLKAGHHGGDGTSSDDLLEAVFPTSEIRGQRFAIISSGRRSNLPDDQTMARLLEKVGESGMYRTDRLDEGKDQGAAPGDDHILMRIAATGELTVCYAYPDKNR